jgi:hypothetical protein
MSLPLQESTGEMLFFRSVKEGSRVVEYVYDRATDTWKPAPFGLFLRQVWNDHKAGHGKKLWEKFEGGEEFEGEHESYFQLLGSLLKPLVRKGKRLLDAPEERYSKSFEEKRRWLDSVGLEMVTSRGIGTKSLNLSITPTVDKKLGYGFLTENKTRLEAALIEALMGNIHRWKGRLNLCLICEKLHSKKTCPYCRGKRKTVSVSRFGTLLRVHKKRCKGRSQAVKAISDLQKHLAQGNLKVSEAVRQYAMICEKFGLPTKWKDNYREYLT